MIELKAVSKTYRRPTGETVDALIDVSLHIDDGEFVAIVGSSGSGKSTLMNILGLLDLPTTGSYCLRGKETQGLSPSAQAQWRNQRIGFVFQTFHLLPRTSALENVELPLLYSDRNNFRGMGRKALEMVGLGDRMSHRPSELSGGQQQRVAIARALVNEPDLLLADEPTGNLDTATGRLVIDLLFELSARHGTTLLLITHDRDLARRCHRTVHMADGRIIEAPGQSDAAGGVTVLGAR